MAVVMLDPLIKSDAVISDCGRYRYRLSRTWGDGKPAVFVMLNPSTADASEDDPTIQRCIGFADKWHCGGLVVVNLFAFMAAKPKAMLAASDPVGPDNLKHVYAATRYADLVVCAWGTTGAYMGQGAKIVDCVKRAGNAHMTSLGTTKDGHPKHPLYLAGDTELQSHRPQAGSR